MNTDRETAKKENKGSGEVQPSNSAAEFFENRAKTLDDMHKNLAPKYDPSTYESLERGIIDMRKEVKAKVKDITDPDQEFLSHTQLRKDFAEEAIQNLTKAAETFQEARENDRLNRPKATDALEDASISLKNLANLIKRPSKK